MQALLLVSPLLLFILVSFLLPIGDMLFRSVENQIVSDHLPRTVASLESWDLKSGEIPDEQTFRSFYVDMTIAIAKRRHTRVGSRLNYESPGISSLFRRANRGMRSIDVSEFPSFFARQGQQWLDADWLSGEFGGGGLSEHLPLTSAALEFWASENPDGNQPDDYVYVALAAELQSLSASGSLGGAGQGALSDLAAAAGSLDELDHISIRDGFLDIDEKWGQISVWQTTALYSPKLTEGYLLNSIDLKKGIDGPEARPESERIYILIFIRTMIMSMAITVFCLLLGYPVAYFLAHQPLRRANLYLILVLLPFWTSLLVRTSAWKVLLQQEGVINDILVAIRIIDDGGRFIMINNQFGTIVAMTHILLPFMILPLYAVMKTIQPSYVRAARSLGANAWTAFRRVYFPQTLSGIGAGSVLVFILAIGYYITPELVGGTKGTFISNRIAYHISSSLNWGLGAALATILFGVVLILYWVYDRIVGIDNVKLG